MKIKIQQSKNQNFPKGWRKVKLGDVVELKYGFGLPEAKRKKGNVPVYGSSGIVGKHDKAMTNAEGIIVGRKGNVGNVYYSEVPFYPIDTVYYIDSLKAKGDLKFFYYLLKQISFKKIDSDVGVPGLNRNIAYSLEITIPNDAVEQKRIANILSGFDDKIELNNKINQNLEQMAQGIFKEWFVDFKFPGYEKSKFIDSELGKIPERWEVKEIKDIVNIKSGFAFKGKDFVDTGKYNLVTIKNVHNSEFKTECQSRLKSLPKNMPEYCLLKTGDILLSLTGNIGRVCLFYGENYLLNQRVAKLKNKKENFYAFTYLLFRSLVLKSQMEALAGGSAQQNLSPVETGKLKIVVPNDAIIEKFSKITNKIIYNILNLERENQKLASLRNLLLPKLMSGEIRVIEKLFIHDFGIVDNDKNLKKIQKNNSNIDPTYITICCGKDRQETKKWLEDLWTIYAPYAEPKFLEKIRKNLQDSSYHSSFHDHSWEMYIGAVLLNKGFSLIPSKGYGPDIQIKWENGKNLWIECVTTNPGDCSMAKGFPKDGPIYDSLDPRVTRITQSLTKKFKKFKEKYNKKIVKENEPFVIAINGARTDTLMGSRALKAAVFAEGNDVLKKRESDCKFRGGFYELKPEFCINKDGKEIKVSTNYFCDGNYSELSAVIYCEDHIINSNNYGRKFAENLYTAFNGYAINKISHEKFIIGKAIIRDEQGGIIQKN